MGVMEDYFAVGPRPQTDGSQLWSSLDAGLRDARHVTGRDESTGVVVEEQRTQRWLGVAGYLSILDQLGSVVVAAGRRAPTQASPRFKLAAATFCGIRGEDERALWALRNSLIHDFSLINIPTSRSGPTLRAFSLRTVGAMVEHPAQDWDGTFPVDQGQRTRVNVREVAEQVERGVERARALYAAGNLDDALPELEVESRYFIRITQASARLPLT